LAGYHQCAFLPPFLKAKAAAGNLCPSAPLSFTLPPAAAWKSQENELHRRKGRERVASVDNLCT